MARYPEMACVLGILGWSIMITYLEGCLSFLSNIHISWEKIALSWLINWQVNACFIRWVAAIVEVYNTLQIRSFIFLKMLCPGLLQTPHVSNIDSNVFFKQWRTGGRYRIDWAGRNTLPSFGGACQLWVCWCVRTNKLLWEVKQWNGI